MGEEILVDVFHKHLDLLLVADSRVECDLRVRLDARNSLVVSPPVPALKRAVTRARLATAAEEEPPRAIETQPAQGFRVA